ncbi:MAG TPA: pyridoxal phosphate-dependent aminotransferase [Thermoanaerobaculia bacterium]|nr:pyridoxal phosphate-dependent aminotransferase [Thermoanaerobaculia bacterium]
MKGSVYMRWAKEHAAARYNLANSGLLACSREDFVFDPGDVVVNSPDKDGYRPLLAAIAERYGTDPEQVVLGQGTSGANFLAFVALVEPGDEVLVEQPTYEPILAALSLVGARVRRFARRFEDGWRPDPDEIRGALAGGRVRLVVMTDPHNPTGVILPPGEMAEIGRHAADAGALLVVDEVYRDIAVPDGPPSHAHLGPHVVATNSLTKSYGLSGLRCGWILAAPEVADRIRRVNDAMGSVGPFPSESLSVAAFWQLPRLAERARSILDPNLVQIRDFLDRHPEWLDCVVPDRSLMVFPRLRKEADGQALHDWLRTRETSIVPGRFFEEPRHFRLGFAVRPEYVGAGLERLSAGLRR